MTSVAAAPTSPLLSNGFSTPTTLQSLSYFSRSDAPEERKRTLSSPNAAIISVPSASPNLTASQSFSPRANGVRTVSMSGAASPSPSMAAKSKLEPADTPVVDLDQQAVNHPLKSLSVPTNLRLRPSPVSNSSSYLENSTLNSSSPRYVVPVLSAPPKPFGGTNSQKIASAVAADNSPSSTVNSKNASQTQLNQPTYTASSQQQLTPPIQDQGSSRDKKNFRFNQSFNKSKDNISIASAASSASFMLRKLSSIGGLARRHSLASLTNLFQRSNDDSAVPSTSSLNNTVENSQKISSNEKKSKKSKIRDRFSLLSRKKGSSGQDPSSMTDAEAIVKAHENTQNLSAAATAEKPSTLRRSPATGSFQQGSQKSMRSNRPDIAQIDPFDPPSLGQADDDDSLDAADSTVDLRQGWSVNHQSTTSIGTHRLQSNVKGILKHAKEYDQEFYNSMPLSDRGRANSHSGILTSLSASSPASHKNSLINTPEQIDGLLPSFDTGAELFAPPSLPEPFVLSQANNLSAPSLILTSPTSSNLASLRQTGAPATPPRPAPKRKLTFAVNMSIQTTWPATVYDRRGEQATCNRLTPALAQLIKEELNGFKLHEMKIHTGSRVNTHFFP